MSKTLTITLGGFVVAAIVAAVVIIKFVTHVDAGHVGVEIHSCSDGGVMDTPVGVPTAFARSSSCATMRSASGGRPRP